ncbi:hypothetical protein GCM10027277_46680 [Pseudoduganella ginsengisoli]|uniref:Uncharacterized protein n=1 Tax=Pseudoduganella ginsengisoli TaxID=1462440 RepID=A0A6L6Q3T2_9BURK|nr:hypothetical protein [Pseudoduganella ginsengisoli]MTW04146.1 hypothetical protein [Pseudoduganella ginsengisoli]
MTVDNIIRGRKFEQTTHSGHSSLAAVGAKTGNPIPDGNRQSDTRTDDLLSGGVTETQRSGSFQKDNKAEDLEKSLGKQPGNRQ